MCCLNKRVIGGLAAVALAVLVFSPSSFGRVLPLLVAAACPLGMLVMMRGIAGQRCQRPEGTAGNGETASASGSADEEIAHLRREIERLRGTAQSTELMTDPIRAGKDQTIEDRRRDRAEERPG